MSTRRFRESDREALRDIYLITRKQRFSWLEDSNLERGDFDRDTKGESIWVCESDSKVVGFISAQVAGKFIHHLFILPQFSNHGLGSALLKDCVAEIGYPAQLKCVAENIDALNFYKSKGWLACSKGEGVDGEYHLLELTENNN